MRRPPRADVLLACALAAGAVLEAVLLGDGSARAALAAAAVCLPIALRRAAPSVAVLACAAALAADALTTNDIGGTLPIAALILTVFSFGVRAERRRAIVVGATVFVVIELAIAFAPDGAAAPDAIFVAIAFLGLPFAGARVLRSRTALATRLAEQVRLLEAEREAQAARAAADERTRMAGALHDLVARGVREMLDEAAAAEAAVGGDRDACLRAVEAVEERGRDTLAEMRRMLGMLRREDEDLALAPQPSLTRLDALADRHRRAGLDLRVEVEGEPHPLTPGTDVAAFRVVEETLGAAAGGARAELVVRWHDAAVELELVLDEPGLAADPVVAAVRERVALFGGRLRTGRRPRGGWCIVAELPTREREAVR